MFVYLLGLPQETSVPVGRIFIEVRPREVGGLTDTHPAILA
jgi:hypothetical protein